MLLVPPGQVLPEPRVILDTLAPLAPRVPQALLERGPLGPRDLLDPPALMEPLGPQGLRGLGSLVLPGIQVPLALPALRAIPDQLGWAPLVPLDQPVLLAPLALPGQQESLVLLVPPAQLGRVWPDPPDLLGLVVVLLALRAPLGLPARLVLPGPG